MHRAKEWEDAETMEVTGETDMVRVANLLPQTTYNLRLVADRDGQRSEPGPEVTLDTATVDCGPKRGFCVIA